ncbi:response regulator [Dyadobacter bucti]|uniref:response regulator n=1 Tax=Dyadobacter bucti TaxID=2572203 RepID=UPI001108CD25|nr:response regulator transcription factor [Dyadobacter bucti]
MSLTSQTRILLVDDHHIFNEGLKRLINEQPDYIVCGQVYQSKDIFQAIEQLRPHLILLDINLKGINGIDIGKRIIKDYPQIKVIVLTMYNQAKLLEESRKIGLHGYLLKDSTTSKLLAGVEAVLKGEFYFDNAVAGSSPTDQDQFIDTFAQKLNLTFREIEIIRLIKNGYTNEQIADQLHLSFFTIKTHRKNIHFKLGLSKVTELIDFAIKNGI